MINQVLISTTAAVTDYTQETIGAVIEWRGRCIQNGVRNALFGIGGFGTVVAVYEFAQPMIETTMPGWLIGAVVGGISAVSIIGGVRARKIITS